MTDFYISINVVSGFIDRKYIVKSLKKGRLLEDTNRRLYIVKQEKVL